MSTERLMLAAVAVLLLAIGVSAWSASPGAAAAGSSPGADQLMETLKQRYPATTFSRVESTPVAEMFEVWMGANVAYVHRDHPEYFFFGRLFDVAKATDLTAGKLAQVRAPASVSPVSFGALPLNDSIKTVRGTGARKVAVFSDPQCPYCAKLEAELAKLNDVTVHTFLVPYLGAEKPVAIWCARDRNRAWERWMRDGDTSALAAGSCEHPVFRNLALSQQLKVTGTPALVFGDGSRIEGLVGAEQIEARFKSLAKAHGAESPQPFRKVKSK